MIKKPEHKDKINRIGAFVLSAVEVAEADIETILASVTVNRIKGLNTRVDFTCELIGNAGQETRIICRLYRGSTLVQDWILVSNTRGNKLVNCQFDEINNEGGSIIYSIKAVTTSEIRSGKVSRRNIESYQYN